MNPIADLEYNRVASRFFALSRAQQQRVRQRLRVRALLPNQLYLMALDSAIDLELKNLSDPEPCPSHPITGRPPAGFCPYTPEGPLVQENPSP